MSYATVFKSVGKYTTYFKECAALPVLFWVRGVALCPIPNQSVHYRTLWFEEQSLLSGAYYSGTAFALTVNRK